MYVWCQVDSRRTIPAPAVNPETLKLTLEPHTRRIDEVHVLVGAGAAARAGGSGLDVANLLKPPLARGELQCIGATTLDEHRKSVPAGTVFESLTEHSARWQKPPAKPLPNT